MEEFNSARWTARLFMYSVFVATEIFPSQECHCSHPTHRTAGTLEPIHFYRFASTQISPGYSHLGPRAVFEGNDYLISFHLLIPSVLA